MNIGVDIDGVIADADVQFRRYMKKTFKRNFPRIQVRSFRYEHCFNFTQEEFKVLTSMFYDEELWMGITPVKRSIESLRVLSKNAKIIIATARPLEVKKVTLKWLKKYKVPYNEIHFTSAEKHLLPSNLKCKFHYFIEDHPDYALRIAELGINVLLFSYPWNKNVARHRKIKRVSNWQDILSIIGTNKT